MIASVQTRRPSAAMTGSVLVLGVVLMIVAVVGFVVVPEHAPGAVQLDPSCLGGWGSNCATRHTGWSQTLYDVARMATWTALIVGVVLVVFGLIRVARRSPAVV